MVSVVQPHPKEDSAGALHADLPQADRALIVRALEFAEPLYGGERLSTGEPVWPHALGLAANLAAIGMDPATRAAGVLFAAPKYLGGLEPLHAKFGAEVAALAAGVEKLYRLRLLTRAAAREQGEILRKMVLAMAEDVRVVLIRLASRVQTLRWFAKAAAEERKAYARETLDLYAPLANRLGVWQLKWELEDLSFRFLEPELYKRIARMLDEKRLERERFIRDAIAALGRGLEAAGIEAEITGRPKHIYSIYSKMRAKRLDFAGVRDVRALRVIVGSVKDCYAALGVAHQLWPPIASEFDDYIARPKENRYRSLHTAVIGPGGRALEVQIRTREMHRHAEFGVAAHWRYKEAGAPAKAQGAFEQKIAWLRQLLAWRDEVPGSPALFDDTVYVLTPQGRVMDLPAGSTPIDFAYALHTDLGHRCRGAKLDGRMAPLDTPLANGQCVEIMAAKTGGPSRDWLNSGRRFIKSHRARQKVRQWFNSLARGEASPKPPRAVPRAISPSRAAPARRKLRPAGEVLVAGSDRLLTQFAKCCKPAPPGPIRGFVTRGRGVSIHREGCASLKYLARRYPRRLIEAGWSALPSGRARARA